MGKIFTFGYGSSTPGAIIDRLHAAEVQYLIDVRSSPYSRYKPEFSRDKFSKTLSDSGISYVFMGDQLGGRPADERCYTNGKVDYEKTKRTEFFRKGLERLSKARSLFTVCLFCSEAQPSDCHRCKLIGVELDEREISVTHILPSGMYQSQTEVIAQLKGDQGSLFGDHFMSRKAYR